MNKISKKIVALVTMAAFVLTLVPFAAFATTVAGSSYAVTSDAAGTLKVVIDLDDATDNASVRLKVDFDGIDAQGVTVSSANADSNSTTIDQVTKTGSTPDTTQTKITYTFQNVSVGTKDVTVNMSVDNGANYDPITNITASGAGSAYVSNTASVKASQIVAVDQDNEKDITVDPEDDAVTVQFDVYDATGDTVSKLPLSDQSASTYTYVWATDADGNFDDAITFASGTAGTIGNVGKNTYVKSVNASGKVVDGNDVKMNFNRPGTYYVYAGVSSKAAANVVGGTNADTAFASDISLVGQPIKVTINARTYDVETFNLTGNVTGGAITADAKDASKFTWDISNDGVEPNGTVEYKVTGYAYQEDKTPAPFVTLDLDVNKSGLELNKEQVSTDKDGKFEFKFTVTKADIYKVTITENGGDGTAATLTVTKDKVSLSDITTVKDGGVMLAGNDSKYSNAVYNNKNVLLSDAVQFEITDTNGNPVINTTPTNYTIKLDAPKDSELQASDLSLAWDPDKEVYTLQYNKGGDYAKDMIPGEYSVRVAFNNSTKAATATFTLGKFGEVKDLAIDLDKDQVTMGTAASQSFVTGTVKYVDENGIKVPADSDVLVTAKGVALSDTTNGESAPKFKFPVVNYSVDNEVYYGSTITVTAFDESLSNLKQATVTVVAEDTDYSLAFDSTQGPANENNRVQVSVVDSEGNVVKDVTGDTYAYVVSSSNEDAKVDVTPANVASGKGSLTIYSDKETTLSIGVVVYDATGEAIYAGNLEYTVGKEDVNADTTVVMTIGSSDLVVNNELVAGDAAPYIANDRTMVPIRVLAQSFGADVDYNDEDNTVTIVDGDTTVVMTIGEKDYTINGEAADPAMDVAPVIGAGDRTYVPVRFAAEALGYEVTALYAADGTTASVLFQK